ncbi:MAG: nucleotidyltransferase domain-containing protein [Planctomycetes bacterium]|nr:nucleotidyltransferase domain-containing protein [Planctomycetota bacterium]
MSPRADCLERARGFVEAASKRVRVAAAYLAGSVARGTQREESDYDIILVSPDFAGVHRVRRPPMVTMLWDHSSGGGLDLLCYTPEEFEIRRNMATIVADMMEYAIRIA